jgi:hypothetical protein
VRIPSGKTDQAIYFVAVDATDLKTRETGLSGFAVYRSRNGGAATAYTTPTTAELSAANMPGVYSLLIDEDTTIASSSDSEEYVVHITHASMAPVTRSVELYRRDTTSGQTITVANGAADADIERIQGSVVATPNVAGVLEVDVTHWLGTAAATPTVAGVPEVDITHFGGTAGTFSGGRPEVNTSHIAGAAVSTSSAQIGVNVVNAGGTAWASGSITAAVFAADAITAAKVASDVSAEIADAVWDEDATGHQTQGTFGQAIGDPVADTNTIYKAVVTDATGATVGVDVAAILADTGTDGVVVASINANAITATSIAADAITAAKIATGAIDADALAADAVAEIADGVWDEDATGHQTGGTFGQAIGDPGADANTIYGAVVTGAAGATIAADIIAVQADTDDIQTRLPAALVSGRIDASVGAMAANVLTAAAINADAITAAKIADGAIDAATFAAGAINAAAIAADAITDAKVAADVTIASVTGAVGSVTGSVGSVAAGGITAASIATGAIDADAIAADAVAEIQAGLSTLDAAGVRSAVGLAAANLDTQLSTIDDFLDTEVAAIKAKTDQLTFTVANKVDSNVTNVTGIAVTGSGTEGDPWGP